MMIGVGFQINKVLTDADVSGEEDSQVIPPDTSNECITQSWFRFLHIIQNPVDLCRPNIISNTQRFLQYALASEAVIDPSHHECLLKLPIIFFKAMRGISVMVNAFLGNLHVFSSKLNLRYVELTQNKPISVW